MGINRYGIGLRAPDAVSWWSRVMRHSRVTEYTNSRERAPENSPATVERESSTSEHSRERRAQQRRAQHIRAHQRDRTAQQRDNSTDIQTQS